jgi:hypothetical protein
MVDDAEREAEQGRRRFLRRFDHEIKTSYRIARR